MAQPLVITYEENTASDTRRAMVQRPLCGAANARLGADQCYTGGRRRRLVSDRPWAQIK